jgi:hypothetical protein
VGAEKGQCFLHVRGFKVLKRRQPHMLLQSLFCYSFESPLPGHKGWVYWSRKER